MRRGVRRERRVGWLLALGTALLAAAAASRVGAEARRFVVDPSHFTVAFLVEHAGYAKVLGTFRQASGSFRFDESTRRLTDVRIEVQSESLFTNQQDRDRHLRSPDFFNVKQFPTILFAAEAVILDEEGRGRLDGELTLLGTTRPLTLEVVWNKSDVSPFPGPDGRRPFVLGASVRAQLRRSEWGMTYGVEGGLVGDEVEIIVELEAHRE